ncbi:hypothetical protein, partial [Rhabdochromatium marinum]|uniref:hypothetical protein n=1 Tax=Rhabdochromatium marinum TaxID=48729 RepID=UPI001A93885A
IGAVLGLGCTSKTTPFPDSCRPMPRADHLLKLLVLDRGMIKAAFVNDSRGSAWDKLIFYFKLT